MTSHVPFANLRLPSPGQREQRGSVLILVLVILGMLSLGAYTFSEMMLSEYRALRAGTDDSRTRAAADSGVMAVMAKLDSSIAKDRSFVDLADQPSLSWTDSVGDEYSLSILSGAAGTHWAQRRGPLDESAKFNVNGLNLDDEHLIESRERLLAIPGMTLQAADSLLDWIDPDENQREFGAESNWYLSQGFCYTPRQDSLRSLQELLLVRGIDVTALFGEDTNANGWLDPQEDDGESSLPNDDRDNSLDAGWSRWLSVNAAESNLNAQGRPKVYVNQGTLATLFRKLETEVGTEAARFVVALRMNGPMDSDGVGRFDSPEEIEKRRASAAARARAQTTESKNFGEFQLENIGGFAINRAGVYSLTSNVELIGRSVEATVDGQEVVLRSPWGDDAQRIEQTLVWLEERLTTTPGNQQVERINIYLAEREVLMTIPNMTSDLATAIIKTRSGQSSSASPGVGWLYKNGMMDLRTFRKLAPYITGQGDVFSGLSVGKVSGVRQATAAMFLIDASVQRPAIRYQEFHAINASSFIEVAKP